jgi:hypothetical protein
MVVTIVEFRNVRRTKTKATQLFLLGTCNQRSVNTCNHKHFNTYLQLYLQLAPVLQVSTSRVFVMPTHQKQPMLNGLEEASRPWLRHQHPQRTAAHGSPVEKSRGGTAAFWLSPEGPRRGMAGTSDVGPNGCIASQ